MAKLAQFHPYLSRILSSALILLILQSITFNCGHLKPARHDTISNGRDNVFIHLTLHNFSPDMQMLALMLVSH